MPPGRTTEDLGTGQLETPHEDVTRLLSAKGLNQDILSTPANQQLHPAQRRFWKDPLALHFSLNSKHAMLRFDGRNYVVWWENLTTTINFLFDNPSGPLELFLAGLDGSDKSSMMLVLLQTIDDSTKGPLSSCHKTLSSLFSAIKKPCDRSEPLDELDSIRRLITLLKDNQPRNTASWLNHHQQLFSQLVKWNTSLDELYGLSVQAGIKLPDGVNHNVFKILVHQRLNAQDVVPSFDKVSEVLQEVEATASAAIPPAIVDQGASVSALRYHPPGKSYTQPVSSHNPIFQAPQSVSNKR
ncbi:hypothetical protein O181_028619 [Austropuccinia psidii MF-1]|uniref:Uncharacterized protein n=1 Tax=Austropuccinia psidii MF-1 TaxID=1389203 RepID=A0A9Q3H3S4_9BASI|nr:hypothetical protein [Austropuccinia psidii MF-1]